MIIDSRLVRSTQANSAIRLGLLGCGGRGTADAIGLVNSAGARVAALADLFPDQLERARNAFDQLARSKRYSTLDPSQLFLGPEAHEEIAHSKQVDAIVIATPPYFHPGHLEAAVKAGKHVYCEKPIAVDVAGAKRVLQVARQAEGRLSLHVGFQIRNAPPFLELVRRIHSGALGTIACGEASYYGTFVSRPDWPGATPVELRLRNWIYDRILSGDIIVEQNIHAIDVCNWILQAHPLRASAGGGRGVRSDPGNVYGHYSVVFEYPHEVTVGFSSTQFDRGWWDVSQRFFGSKGVAESHYSGPIAIYGEEPWAWDTASSPTQAEPKEFSPSGLFHDNLAEADARKHKAFIRSISNGRFENQAAQGADSALSCILAREAAYSGELLGWDQLLRSNQQWDYDVDLRDIRLRT